MNEKWPYGVVFVEITQNVSYIHKEDYLLDTNEIL